jgi:thiol:disulfide interchange protein
MIVLFFIAAFSMAGAFQFKLRAKTQRITNSENQTPSISCSQLYSIGNFKATSVISKTAKAVLISD